MNIEYSTLVLADDYVVKTSRHIISDINEIVESDDAVFARFSCISFEMDDSTLMNVYNTLVSLGYLVSGVPSSEWGSVSVYYVLLDKDLTSANIYLDLDSLDKHINYSTNIQNISYMVIDFDLFCDYLKNTH